MAELVTVSPNEVILASHINAIMNRTLQRYDDRTTRDSENPSPDEGDLCFLQDVYAVQIYRNGAWRPIDGFVGEIRIHAGSSTPPGFLFCHGQEVSRTTYAELFAEIGTTYGEGDGSTTFNLPDLRQRFPLGKAASGTGNVLGSTGGALTQTLTTSHLPAHTHGNGSLATSSTGSHSHGSGSLAAASGGSHSHTIALRSAPLDDTSHGHPRTDRAAGASGAPGGDSNPGIVNAGGAHTHTITGSTASGGSHSHNVTGSTASAGSGNSFSKLPPYLVVNHVIRYI